MAAEMKDAFISIFVGFRMLWGREKNQCLNNNGHAMFLEQFN